MQLEYSHFSTDMFVPKDRFGIWRDNISVIYEPSLVPGETASDFRARVYAYKFGQATLARCTGSLQAFRRTEAMIADDAIDHYMVQVFRSGRCRIEAPGYEGCILPGEVCVFDNARPLNTVNEPFDLLAFVVPRSELAPYLDRPDDLHYMRLPAACLLGSTFARHLNRLYDMAPALDEEMAASLFAPTLELLAAALNDRAGQGTSKEQTARTILISRVCHYIDANLADPSLTAETVARELGLSPPALRTMFAPPGGLDALIHERRMLAAARMLRNVRGPYEVSDLAVASGFPDERDFIQTFYRRFGRLPGDVRTREQASSDAGRRPVRRLEWALWLGEV